MKRLAALLLICLMLCGCEAQQTCFYMNTVMDLKVWGIRSKDALEQSQSLLSELESTWSASRDDSLLSRLNRGESIPLTDGQSSLLNQVEAMSVRTGGAFDPKMGAVSQAWGFYNESHRVPEREEIAAALEISQWDLGGALKGYAGDRIVDILEQTGIDHAMLNLGGNIQTYGEKPDGTPWQVGIQDPDGSGYLGILSVTGTCAVVTSGDYQRYFEWDGVTYHHILDPGTGYPANSGLRSVTVICRDGLTADALSTALFVMGVEAGSDFWRKSDDFEAVFVCADGTIHATEGVTLAGCEHEVICREK